MLRNSFAELALDIDKFSLQVKGGADVMTRKTTMDVLHKVVARNPVDTGRSRASWNTQADSPDFSTPLAETPRGTLAYEADISLRKAVGLPKSDTYYITNGLDYIEDLERGKSTQAPSGMVRIAIAEVVAGFRAFFK